MMKLAKEEHQPDIAKDPAAVGDVDSGDKTDADQPSLPQDLR